MECAYTGGAHISTLAQNDGSSLFRGPSLFCGRKNLSILLAVSFVFSKKDFKKFFFMLHKKRRKLTAMAIELIIVLAYIACQYRPYEYVYSRPVVLVRYVRTSVPG